MREISFRCAFFILIGCVLPLNAQLTLSASERITVQNQGRIALMSPIKCDSDENLYMQLPDPGRFLAGPLLRVTPDGKKTLRFSLNSIPGMGDTSVSDFVIGPRGDVYLLVSLAHDSQYVARFDKEGSFVSKTKLDKDFEFWRLGLFASGDYFATGKLVAESAGDKHEFTPAAVIIDTQGRVLRNVQLTGDLTLESKSSAESKASQYKQFARSVLGSFIESGEDGNVYLGRRSPSGPVYVISPAGEVIQRIMLKPPDNAELADLRVSHGRLLAMFLQHTGKPSGSISRAIFSVLDVHTSEMIAQYAHSSAELGAALACYVPDEFTFFTTTSDDMLQIVRAKAH